MSNDDSRKEQVRDEAIADGAERPSELRPRRLLTRVMILIRRVHLYAGLFLLPWVFLYGITGAMFNHQWLFPDVRYQAVSDQSLVESTMSEFPVPRELAKQVANEIERTANVTVSRDPDEIPEFTNPLMFQTHDAQGRHVVQIDPIGKTAAMLHHAENPESPKPVIKDLHHITLDPDPHSTAQRAAARILNANGVKSGRSPQPIGWTKLNFLATVDGTPCRITYVLKDGHVDIAEYTGQDGMTPRHFFLRLHTSHGQPPHQNARWFWSRFVDIMAIAMVTWGVSGLIMWWQIKRTRLIGFVVIAASLATAAIMYFGMHDFYAKTLL